MANEGSTKPTYSELEAQLAEAEEIIESERCQFRKMYDVDVSASKVIEDLGKAYDELARVRGLLQRGIKCATATVEAETMRYVGTPLTVDDHISELDEWIAEAKLVPPGAESADIGKLEAADTSGVEMGKVNGKYPL